MLPSAARRRVRRRGRRSIRVDVAPDASGPSRHLVTSSLCRRDATRRTCWPTGGSTCDCVERDSSAVGTKSPTSVRFRQRSPTLEKSAGLIRLAGETTTCAPREARPGSDKASSVGDRRQRSAGAPTVTRRAVRLGPSGDQGTTPRARRRRDGFTRTEHLPAVRAAASWLWRWRATDPGRSDRARRSLPPPYACLDQRAAWPQVVDVGGIDIGEEVIAALGENAGWVTTCRPRVSNSAPGQVAQRRRVTRSP